jgi:hypothetical protein
MNRFLFYLFVLFSIVLLTKCITINKSTNKTIVLEKQYDIVMKLDKNSNAFNGIIEKTHIDFSGDILIQSLYFNNWTLYFSNLTTGVVYDSIDLNIFPNQFIENFEIISPDSIVLYFTESKQNENDNQTILIINRKKEILANLSPNNFPFQMSWMTFNEIQNNDIYKSEFYYFQSTIFHNKVYIPLIRKGIHPTNKRQDSLIAIYDFKEKNIKRLPIKFSSLPSGYDWTSEFKIPNGINVNGALYTYFPCESIIYKISLKDDKIESKFIDFRTIDPIKPYPIDQNIDDHGDKFRSKFYDLTYLANKSQFIWVARYGCDSSDSRTSTMYFNDFYPFVILDKSLNKIGEGLIPPNYSRSVIPYKNGFLLYKRDTDSITYTYFTYSFVDLDPIVIKKQIIEKRKQINELNPDVSESESFRRYIEKLSTNPEVKNRKFIFIPLQYSCSSCIPIYAKIIKNNKNNILRKNIDIILISDNIEEIRSFKEIIKTNQSVTWGTLSDLKIYEDTSHIYNNFINPWINLLYIEFDEKSIINKKLIVSPSKIEEFKNILN